MVSTDPDVSLAQMDIQSSPLSKLVLACVCLCISGCTIPEFEHPIESFDKATVPAEWFGLYSGVDCDHLEVCNLHIQSADKDAPKGVFQFVLEEKPLNHAEMKVTKGYCIATPFGRSHVLQIPIFEPDSKQQKIFFPSEVVWGKTKIDGYLFILAQVESDEIKLAMIDPAFLARAIENGEIQGSVKRSAVSNTAERESDGATTVVKTEPRVESLTVASGSKELRSFVEQNIDRGLFEKLSKPSLRRKK